MKEPRPTDFARAHGSTPEKVIDWIWISIFMDLMVWIHIKCMTALFGKNFRKFVKLSRGYPRSG